VWPFCSYCSCCTELTFNVPLDTKRHVTLETLFPAKHLGLVQYIITENKTQTHDTSFHPQESFTANGKASGKTDIEIFHNNGYVVANRKPLGIASAAFLQARCYPTNNVKALKGISHKMAKCKNH